MRWLTLLALRLRYVVLEFKVERGKGIVAHDYSLWKRNARDLARAEDALARTQLRIQSLMPAREVAQQISRRTTV